MGKGTLLIPRRLRWYLQLAQTPWTDSVWNTVDFMGIGMAFQALPLVQQFKISKAIHGWLATGHKRQQQDNMAITGQDAGAHLDV